MFKIPDRVADLFGDHQLRVEFERALLVAGKLERREERYFQITSLSEVARISYCRLDGFDWSRLPAEQRELLAGVRALAHRLITSGYAIDVAAKADQRVGEDWTQLLDFVQRKCAARVGLADHEGWERCFTYIVGHAEEAIQAKWSDKDRISRMLDDHVDLAEVQAFADPRQPRHTVGYWKRRNKGQRNAAHVDAAEALFGGIADRFRLGEK
ncbi:hypothetical protein [Streptomyces sp. LN785]|uniref:hypothetical protein n=1 Tax=Streptomyces sp. LN785 TaxID=3112983 RepID=UPI00371221AA